MFHIQAGQKIIIHKIASTTPAIAYKSCVETLREVSYKINLINRKVKGIANLGGEQPILAEFPCLENNKERYYFPMSRRSVHHRLPSIKNSFGPRQFRGKSISLLCAWMHLESKVSYLGTQHKKQVKARARVSKRITFWVNQDCLKSIGAK